MCEIIQLTNMNKVGGTPPEIYRIHQIQPLDDTFLIELRDDHNDDKPRVMAQIPTLHINGDNLKKDDQIRVYFSNKEPVKDIAAGYEFRDVNTVKLVKQLGIKTSSVVTPFRQCARGNEYDVTSYLNIPHSKYLFIGIKPNQNDEIEEFELAVKKDKNRPLLPDSRIKAEWDAACIIPVPNVDKKVPLLSRFEVLQVGKDRLKTVKPRKKL